MQPWASTVNNRHVLMCLRGMRHSRTLSAMLGFTPLLSTALGVRRAAHPGCIMSATPTAIAQTGRDLATMKLLLPKHHHVAITPPTDAAA